MHVVSRTCTETKDGESHDLAASISKPLSAYRQLPGYVLLGEPGAGKTIAFKKEAEEQDACLVSARDFITFDDRPEWHKDILFIDGLDEIRAGSRDARAPFDAIRARLNKLGCPGFRVSCREADWFGAVDQKGLESVSPNGEVAILHLDPLTKVHIVDILIHNPRIADADQFVEMAKQRGLNELLINPQVLDMLTKAVSDEVWPETRKQTFDLACRKMLREENLEHIQAENDHPANQTQLLYAAGFLCAVQLISGNVGYTLVHLNQTGDFPCLDELSYDDESLLKKAAQTKLFRTINDGQVAPIHRHVAEFLAAKYISHAINDFGLPIGRVLALITGEDGVVVSELRGLSAWLAAICTKERSAIIDRDPLGVVLYGDVQGFSPQDKRRILDRLQREAERYPWFRSANWTASPFGALATLDMEEEFRSILVTSDRADARQALADCVLDAMSYGVIFPTLENTLMDIVRDNTWWSRVRQASLEVFLTRYDTASSRTSIKELVTDIRDGVVTDSDDNLLGHLLAELYPANSYLCRSL